MGDVQHLVPVAQADDRRKIVLDDAEVVAVVGDVRRQEERVAAAQDTLLAQVGRAPIDFVHQLVGLHDFRWLCEALAHLGEEGDIAMRDGLVILESRVGELLRTPVRGALHEGSGARVVPALGARYVRYEGHQP